MRFRPIRALLSLREPPNYLPVNKIFIVETHLEIIDAVACLYRNHPESKVPFASAFTVLSRRVAFSLLGLGFLEETLQHVSSDYGVMLNRMQFNPRYF